jgi:YidC/Oxa1 family membrane protein insertase
MDRRTIIAFALSFLILFLYPLYIKSITPPQQPVSDEVQPVENVEKKRPEESAFFSDSPDSGSLKKSVQEETEEFEETRYIIENNDIIAHFTDKGAAIDAVFLKEYTTIDGQADYLPVYAVSDAATDERIGSVRIAGKDSRFNNKFNTRKYTVLDITVHSISFQSPIIDGIQVIKKYAFGDKRFSIEQNLLVTNLSDEQKRVGFEVASALSFFPDDKFDRSFVDGVIQSYDKHITAKLKNIQKDGFSFAEYVDWVAIERKYFAVITQPAYDVEAVRIIDINNDKLVSYIQSKPFELAAGDTVEKKTSFYAGPKLDSALSSYNAGYESILYRGFLAWLKKLTLVLLNFFYGFLHNYGYAIIALTILVKIVLTPLTHKSFQSMRKMQELQPHMKALQEKHKDNPQQLNKEVMELYKKHKANPLGGCLPMVLQIPIFIALYRTLSQAVELRGAPFIFWIQDLSAPDKMFENPFGLPFDINLLPILMIASMVVQQKMTPTTVSKEQEMTMLLMPLVFGLLFYGLPSGLVLYWFVSNILTIAHQGLLRKKQM